MRSHLLIFTMCLVSSAMGSVFTLSMHQASADAEDIPNRIKAHEFVLVDSNGDNRARLGFNSNEKPFLRFFTCLLPATLLVGPV